ncbi:MAG: DUF721 domain-containing protein [Nitrospirae bacterium]|nr:DUF721 domain-containing protein [Nitrospirota bacterium]
MNRAGDLLKPIIKNLGIEDNLRLAEIKKDWNNLFKDPLSFHMFPSKLSAGEILINVDSAVWLQELNYYRDDIAKKLSKYGVKEARLRLGRVLRNTKPEVKSQKLKRLSTQEISYINEVVFKIHDPDLRETVKKALEKAIALKKTKIRFD